MSNEVSAQAVNRSGLLRSEDWWAVWLGLFIVVLGAGQIWHIDLLGWAAKFGVWIDPSKAVGPGSKGFAWLGSIGSLVATYVFTLVVTSIGAYFMGTKVKKFVAGYTVIYWITMAATVIGNYAYLAATPNKREAFNIGWSLSLGELGFVIALLAGLVIGNFFPKVTRFLSDAAKPEWYIKTGIVILGMNIGIQAISALGLAGTVIVRGMCAVVEAYLIYWPIVYFVARKFFKFTPEWAAPMASGISICGVAAAIATGSAIKARQIIPTILASVIIVFVAVELLILPFAAAYFLPSEPMVAGSWLGLVVKSDGVPSHPGQSQIRSSATVRSSNSASITRKAGSSWLRRRPRSSSTFSSASGPSSWLSSGPFTISMTRGQPSHPGLARFPNGKSGNASRNSSSVSSWPWSSFLQLAGCSRASSTLRKPAPDRLTSCGPSSLASASSLSAW